MRDEHRAIFMGINSIFICKTIEENNQVYVVKNNKFLPMITRKSLLFENVQKKLSNFKERRLVDLTDGLTEDTVRIYPFDLLNCNEDASALNMDQVGELELAKTKAEHYHKMYLLAQRFISMHGIEEQFMSEVKSKYGLWTGLKPQYAFAQEEKNKKKK